MSAFSKESSTKKGKMWGFSLGSEKREMERKILKV
uniref:Uncharacterized protein n=1 Tax=Marseillevirus sp. TaxID=2809551 RepID=A0AA96EMT9_9VIRU|nr:hypothetical protein MarDSR_326 [Marseillevirus sp.]